MLVSCPSTRGHKSNEDLVLWYLDSHLFSFCTNNRDSQLVFYHWSREKRAFQIGRNDRGHKPLFYPIRHVCKTFWTHKSPAWPPFFILWKNAQWPHLLFLLVKRNQTCNNVLTVFLRRKCNCLFSSVLCRHFFKGLNQVLLTVLFKFYCPTVMHSNSTLFLSLLKCAFLLLKYFWMSIKR